MRYSATIDLGLKCIRKFDRRGGDQSIAVIRVPVLALRGNVWRDFLDIIRQRAPPAPTPTQVFAFFRRWPLPANVNSHCHRLACALTVIGEKISPAILGLEKFSMDFLAIIASSVRHQIGWRDILDITVVSRHGVTPNV